MMTGTGIVEVSTEIETEGTGAMSGMMAEDGNQDQIGTAVLMNVIEDPTGRYMLS